LNKRLNAESDDKETNLEVETTKKIITARKDKQSIVTKALELRCLKETSTAIKQLLEDNKNFVPYSHRAGKPDEFTQSVMDQNKFLDERRITVVKNISEKILECKVNREDPKCFRSMITMGGNDPDEFGEVIESVRILQGGSIAVVYKNTSEEKAMKFIDEYIVENHKRMIEEKGLEKQTVGREPIRMKNNNTATQKNDGTTIPVHFRMSNSKSKGTIERNISSDEKTQIIANRISGNAWSNRERTGKILLEAGKPTNDQETKGIAREVETLKKKLEITNKRIAEMETEQKKMVMAIKQLTERLDEETMSSTSSDKTTVIENKGTTSKEYVTSTWDDYSKDDNDVKEDQDMDDEQESEIREDKTTETEEKDDDEKNNEETHYGKEGELEKEVTIPEEEEDIEDEDDIFYSPNKQEQKLMKGYEVQTEEKNGTEEQKEEMKPQMLAFTPTPAKLGKRNKPSKTQTETPITASRCPPVARRARFTELVGDRTVTNEYETPVKTGLVYRGSYGRGGGGRGGRGNLKKLGYNAGTNYYQALGEETMLATDSTSNPYDNNDEETEDKSNTFSLEEE
jgi:hypothetical protein